MRPSRRDVVLGLAGAALSPQRAAQGQDFPSGQIKIIVGSAAGTPPDMVTRMISSEITQTSGWRFLLENRPGAIQSMAAAEVLRQPADGHTLLTIAMSVTAAPALLPSIGFNLEKDFAPVVALATSYHVLVVHPSVPAQSLAELVALLKREPDSLNFSSGGFGTPAHLAGEMFKLQTGVRARHVPYQALPRAIGDLLNGTNHFQFITPLPVLDLIGTGKLRALAVTGPARLPTLKDIPTVGEAGFPDLIIRDWFGVVAKAGTRDQVVAQLNRVGNQALATSRIREAFAKLSAEPSGGTPAEFGALIRRQTAHWSKVITESGIKMHQ